MADIGEPVACSRRVESSSRGKRNGVEREGVPSAAARGGGPAGVLDGRGVGKVDRHESVQQGCHAHVEPHVSFEVVTELLGE